MSPPRARGAFTGSSVIRGRMGSRRAVIAGRVRARHTTVNADSRPPGTVNLTSPGQNEAS